MLLPESATVPRHQGGSPIRREGERTRLDTTLNAMAALQDLISMGLRLNEEAITIGAASPKGTPAPARPAAPRWG